MDAVEQSSQIEESKPQGFATWKTIKLGTQKTVEDLSQALRDDDFRIGANAAQILKDIQLAENETEIELVLLTVRDLGFKESARRDDIYERAGDLGFDLVPGEVGPQLRLQYTNQRMDEWMALAMRPIAGSAGDPRVFYVGRNDGGRWLHGRYGYPDSMWGSYDHWVFARSKQN